MDTSTISFAGYTFDADKGCFTCIHVIDGAPVLLFLHEGNGDLQFMCGVDDHDFEKDCQFVHATHILDEQPDLASLPNVELGHLAERIDAQSPWAVHPLTEDE